jgi:hypothetical protein
VGVPLLIALILGDSLPVMASLAEREGLRGQVQCIYIDPPYGIKFNSNFQWSTTTRDVKDKADHITREPAQVKAFRDTWRDGIHSYLTYLRDRLTVARDLLSNSGSIFVQTRYPFRCVSSYWFRARFLRCYPSSERDACSAQGRPAPVIFELGACLYPPENPSRLSLLPSQDADGLAICRVGGMAIGARRSVRGSHRAMSGRSPAAHGARPSEGVW